MQLRWHNKKLRQKLNKFNYTRQPVSFKGSKTVGLLFDATEPWKLDIIKNYVQKLTKQEKKVTVLAFFNDKQKRDHYLYKFFNREQLDKTLIPNTSDVKDFIDKPFDILINLSLEELVSLEYIAALSKAHLRIGPSTDKLYCYDLMIDVGNENLDFFIAQIDYFLNTVKNKRHEVSSI